MSETNGHNTPKPEWLERLDRLDASHVKLMTDHELFVQSQEQAWARHEKFVAEHERWVAEQEHYREEQKQRDAALDKRIADLVSGTAAFMGEQNNEHREFVRQYDAQREQDRLAQIERDKHIDDRIDKLVSGIGEFIRSVKEQNAK